MCFLREIEEYYLYDEGFEESVHMLPCVCHPFLAQRKEYHKNFAGRARGVPKKELFNKMQRCIFEEKSLDKREEENGYGIWKEMFYF